MLILDTRNGNISVDGFSFHSHMQEEDFLNSIMQNSSFLLNNKSDNYSYYSVEGLSEGEYSMGFSFNKSRLYTTFISLGRKFNYPPFEITDDEKLELKRRLFLIGGESQYQWGEVFVNEDRKGGLISICVKYR